jgi:hypothetical protein
MVLFYFLYYVLCSLFPPNAVTLKAAHFAHKVYLYVSFLGYS